MLPAADIPRKDPRETRAATGRALLVLGLLGLAAAFVLAVERVMLLADPDYIPSCSLNPVLSCGSVMTTEQAQVLGFPNPFIGVVAFTVVVTTAVVVLTGAALPRWYWSGLAIGCVLGLVFVHWLIYQSLYSINALCPYCMVVWAVQLPLTIIAVGKAWPPGRLAAAVAPWRWHILVIWYVIVLALIAERFWYYWSTLL
ncbi:vitamin K epoxide reductase family protein [Lolliginicoccus levis]|uniref:vitamin K epoxide reductase family protein n=1 Tax=Lolliginicoccus levis TaxID=2919542 RepID=UPI00241CF053|nr:vitamin K epoxide reductase family protein [Lolliginicoccus levis]